MKSRLASLGLTAFPFEFQYLEVFMYHILSGLPGFLDYPVKNFGPLGNRIPLYLAKIIFTRNGNKTNAGFIFNAISFSSGGPPEVNSNITIGSKLST